MRTHSNSTAASGVPVSGDAPPSDAAILAIASSVGMPSSTGADTLVLFARALLAACAPLGVPAVAPVHPCGRAHLLDLFDDYASATDDGYWKDDSKRAALAIIEALQDELKEHGAAGVPAPAPLRTALDLTLTQGEAQNIAAFLDDDAESDAEVVRLLIGDGHSGYGLYAAHPDYPGEGAMLVKNLPAPDGVSASDGETDRAAPEAKG